MADNSLPSQIAQQLRRDILRGKLPPGTPIKERENASERGVSRTPMREAIRILAQEGLVHLRPSRSPVVASPSYREVADQVELMVMLEIRSAELACKNASGEEIAAILELVEYIAVHFDDTDPLDMFDVDMAFHSAIAEASHNAPIAEVHRGSLQRLWRARYLSAVQVRNRERLVDEHRRIAEALAARDPEAAAAAIRHHLRNMKMDIRAAMEAERSD